MPRASIIVSWRSQRHRFLINSPLYILRWLILRHANFVVSRIPSSRWFIPSFATTESRMSKFRIILWVLGVLSLCEWVYLWWIDSFLLLFFALFIYPLSLQSLFLIWWWWRTVFLITVFLLIFFFLINQPLSLLASFSTTSSTVTSVGVVIWRGGVLVVLVVVDYWIGEGTIRGGHSLGLVVRSQEDLGVISCGWSSVSGSCLSNAPFSWDCQIISCWSKVALFIKAILRVIIISIEVRRVSSMPLLHLLFFLLIMNLLITLNLIVTRLSTSSDATFATRSSASHNLIVIVEHKHHPVQTSTHLLLSISALHVTSPESRHLILTITCTMLIGISQGFT